MPFINFGKTNPLEDGRQSARALAVRRGVQRLLINMGHSVLPEVTLKTGRRADLMVLTQKGEFWIIEIKSSIEDFRVDKKWPEYRAFSDRLFFATHPEVPTEIFPQECGKSLMLRFARSGAHRLLAAELAGIDIANLPDE
jgi:hypothetical protein